MPQKTAVLSNSNLVSHLEPALARRILYKVYVGLPGLEDRAAIWLIHLAKVAERANKSDLFCNDIRTILLEDQTEWLSENFLPGKQKVSIIHHLAEWSNGLSRADIKNVIDRVVLGSAMMELTICEPGPITGEDFHHAIEDYISQNKAAGFMETEQE
jgi:SpoVK/Ycf46/Vps4 family AAA+-type ATPase